MLFSKISFHTLPSCGEVGFLSQQCYFFNIFLFLLIRAEIFICDREKTYAPLLLNLFNKSIMNLKVVVKNRIRY